MTRQIGNAYVGEAIFLTDAMCWKRFLEAYKFKVRKCVISARAANRKNSERNCRFHAYTSAQVHAHKAMIRTLLGKD
jgi:hypothetical protein